MSASPISTPEQLVALARALRAEGCVRMKWDGVELELLGPEKPGLSALKEQVGDLPIEQREEILRDVKRQLDEDLFGAT